MPILLAAASTSPSVTLNAMGWPTARYWSGPSLRIGVGDHAIVREVKMLGPGERTSILGDGPRAVDDANDLHRDVPRRARKGNESA